MKTFIAFSISALVLFTLALGLRGQGYTETTPEAVIPVGKVKPGVAPPVVQPPPQSSQAVVSDGEEIDGALKVQGRLSHAVIGEASFDELYAEIRLEAGELLPDGRPPLNVALVIDRSGSMRGEAMSQARAAAKSFVEALDEEDRVALVSFDHVSRVDVPSVVADREGKMELLAAIERIRASGATNISDGLKDGFIQVEQNREPNTVDRVVLMTDGFPNAGLTTSEGLAALSRTVRNQGVTVSALGFGTGYNAQMLVAMATEGAGNHRYIQDAQDIAKAFTDELDDLQHTAASGIRLYLEPAKGVRILDVYGFSRQQDSDQERITLGDLRAQGRRSVLVRLGVSAEDAPYTQQLLKVRAHYMDRLEEGQAEVQLELDVERSGDGAAVTASINREVMTRVEEVLAMSSLQEIVELYEQGQVERAQRYLEEEQRRSQAARRTYGIEESARTRQIDSMRDRVGGAMRAAPRAASPQGRSVINSVSAESVPMSQGF